MRPKTTTPCPTAPGVRCGIADRGGTLSPLPPSSLARTRSLRLATGPAFLLLLLPAALLWSRAGAESPVPPTHSEQMKKLLRSNRSDSADRIEDSLDRVERESARTTDIVKKLRADIVLSPSGDLGEELNQYTQTAQTLLGIHEDLATIQADMNACTTLCARAEASAAQSQPPSHDHAAQMAKLTAASNNALKSLQKSVEALEKQASTDNDPRLTRLADYLTQETDVFGQVVALCQLAQAHHAQHAAQPQPQGADGATDPAAPAHVHAAASLPQHDSPMSCCGDASAPHSSSSTSE